MAGIGDVVVPAQVIVRQALTGHEITTVQCPASVADVKRRVARIMRLARLEIQLISRDLPLSDEALLDVGGEIMIVRRPREMVEFLAELSAATVSNGFLRRVPDLILHDQECVIAVLKRNGMELSNTLEHMIDNEQVVTAAVGSNGMALQFASERLRACPRVASIAARSDPFSLEFVDGLTKSCDLVFQGALQGAAFCADPAVWDLLRGHYPERDLEVQRIHHCCFGWPMNILDEVCALAGI